MPLTQTCSPPTFPTLLPQYPEGIRKYDYDPTFAIRGLHYDIQKVSGALTLLMGHVPQHPSPEGFLSPRPLPLCPQSLLMKIDAYHYVQLGTAYRSVPAPPCPPPSPVL